MASTFDRIIYCPDDVLTLKIEFWYVLQVFCQCFTCDSHLTTVYQVRTFEEIFQNCWDAAYSVHIFHIVLARGSAATLSQSHQKDSCDILEICDVRRSVRNFLEVINGKRNIGSSCNCKQVQDLDNLSLM